MSSLGITSNVHQGEELKLTEQVSGLMSSIRISDALQ